MVVANPKCGVFCLRIMESWRADTDLVLRGIGRWLSGPQAISRNMAREISAHDICGGHLLWAVYGGVYPAALTSY